MTRTAKKPRAQGMAVPRAKVWLEIDGDYVFGRGIGEILKAIERTGSIKAAAAELKKSYRHVWAKVKEVEQALGAPLVQTQIGGGDSRRSSLTALARDLVADFDSLRDRVFDLVGREYQKRLSATLARHGRG